MDKMVQRFEKDCFLTSDLGIAAAVLSSCEFNDYSVEPDEEKDGRFLFRIKGDGVAFKKAVSKWWIGELTVNAKEFAGWIKALKRVINKGKPR